VRAKLFKVDPAGLAEECHPDWDEALLMVAGDLTLVLDGVHVVLQTGDFLLIPRGVPHRILPGTNGAFVLLDPGAGVPSSE
jgi:quercetin dioxygenase-like cupin family protein